ncbi:MAG: DUF2384 domain-containing protein [Actinomycetota bacterium]|nr:DUF2384 domain-containing protein [Actinomycetota bacterium]
MSAASVNKVLLETMGLKDSDLKKQKARGMLAFDAIIRKGIPCMKLQSLKEALALTDSQVADCLGISLRTFQRKRDAREKLSVHEGDRFFRAARLFAIAASALGSRDKAREWLWKSQKALADRAPIEAMQTEAGAREIEARFK